MLYTIVGPCKLLRECISWMGFRHRPKTVHAKAKLHIGSLLYRNNEVEPYFAK